MGGYMYSSFQKVALLIYYHKLNRYSFNALVGAIETEKDLDQLPIHFANNAQELEEKLDVLSKKFCKIVVAFSFMTCQYLEIQKLISYLKKRFPYKTFFIAGGPHPTGDPCGTLNMGFDVVVRGEGEQTFPEIIRRLISDENYRSVSGIAFLEGTKCFLNPLGKRPDINYYPPFAVKHKKFGPIEISRGCPWACRFCQTSYIFGTRVRHRSISNICRYVQIMKENGLTDIRFISPNAFMYGSSDGKTPNISAIEELLKSIREILSDKGRIFFGTFPSEVRPDSVTPEILELVKKYCNNDNIVIGGQSGSEKVLNLTGRGHSVEDIRRAVELTLKSGLKANVDLIFGLPGETEEDSYLTLQLAKELIKMGARIHAHTFMPLVGTPFENMPPGKISPKIRKELGRLTSAGKVYGQWHAQEEIAKYTAKIIQESKRILNAEV
jgi:B12-binding domain/radical SAM domain protein